MRYIPAFIALSTAACSDTSAPAAHTITPEHRLQAFADSLTIAQRDVWASGGRSIVLTITFDTAHAPTYLYFARPRP